MVVENDNRVTVQPGDMRLILALEGKEYISRYVMERLKKKECKMEKNIGYSTDDEKKKSDAKNDEEMSDTNDQWDESRKLKIDVINEGSNN